MLKNSVLDSTKVATKLLRCKKKVIYFINTFSTIIEQLINNSRPPIMALWLLKAASGSAIHNVMP